MGVISHRALMSKFLLLISYYSTVLPLLFNPVPPAYTQCGVLDSSFIL